MANFLTEGKTITHSARSRRFFGTPSGIPSTSRKTVPVSRSRSSSFPCATTRPGRAIDTANNNPHVTDRVIPLSVCLVRQRARVHVLRTPLLFIVHPKEGRRMSSASPITEFLDADERARAHQVDTAPVALATADEQGHPSVRMVLLRGVDERGFVFFTNYHSRKGRELDANPHAALCFHWVTLDEQIRVEGNVERISDRESDEYFATRPRGSQLGAWASDQSAMLPSRELLESKYRETESRF